MRERILVANWIGCSFARPEMHYIFSPDLQVSKCSRRNRQFFFANLWFCFRGRCWIVDLLFRINLNFFFSQCEQMILSQFHHLKSTVDNFILRTVSISRFCFFRALMWLARVLERFTNSVLSISFPPSCMVFLIFFSVCSDGKCRNRKGNC